ncbi:MAG: hypothetical protein HY852_09855 [Bradyrhizobium sp.]|uniref:hypothetical protein n=1 Tax=Bradyrhizobium sp. TaxID=376 RepID=UPI0025C68C7F|nr:hypothetical protein [Bradyrhizobium sp.]MBI5262104.1 hypothetical protein [Bradyrhizobium sp.]
MPKLIWIKDRNSEQSFARCDYSAEPESQGPGLISSRKQRALRELHALLDKFHNTDGKQIRARVATCKSPVLTRAHIGANTNCTCASLARIQENTIAARDNRPI